MPNTLTRNTDPRTDWGPHADYDPDAHWDVADERPDDN